MTEEQARARLAVLAVASGEVVLRPRGVAGSTTIEADAYLALANDRVQLGKLVPELTGIVQTGSPAAVIYATHLLGRLGHDLSPLLAPYADDRREVTMYPGGCRFETVWLAEATRRVSEGDAYWRHPDRATTMSADERARRVRALEAAAWFEQPSADPDGAWVRDFVTLAAVPARELIARREVFEDLATSSRASVAGRVYGALLVATFDRAAGATLLAQIGSAGGTIPWHERKRGLWSLVRRLGGRPYRLRERPIAEVLDELGRPDS